MKYIIYEMIQPEEIKKIVPDGYYEKTIYRDVLQKLQKPNVEAEHPTMESAINEITTKKEHLKHLTLTILPVFTILYDGEIY